jgi:protein ImuB
VGLEETEPPADPECLFLDITGCAHLFGNEENLAQQVVADLRRLGLTGRVAIADTIGAAWAVAAFGPQTKTKEESTPRRGGSPSPTRHRFQTIVPPGEQSAALNALPVKALRISAEIAQTLEDLGIRTIGQLAALPRETLPCASDWRFCAGSIRRSVFSPSL